jgi:hypothetical protein
MKLSLPTCPPSRALRVAYAAIDAALRGVACADGGVFMGAES